MSRTIAKALRRLANRLDPPTPIVLNIDGRGISAKELASRIDWSSKPQDPGFEET